MFEPPLPLAGHKRKRASSHLLQETPQPRHPYLTGNFAPIQQTLPLTPCTYTGTIPVELAGGQYVRNGSNPVSNEDLGRDAHWFDGDGMLAGVLFRQDEENGEIQPEFVNRYILTDLYLSTLSSPRLRVPILPSIATLVNPLYSLFYVTLRILRTVLLVILSFLPGSKQKINKISVANTNIVYHDGRALATCESGPPMRIQLPELETVGWYNGAWAQGEEDGDGVLDKEEMRELHGKKLGEDSAFALLGWIREWTTAHPKVDPVTKEMLMFHSSFAPPYVQYSIIPQQQHTPNPNTPAVSYEHTTQPRLEKLLNATVPGVAKAKMMHDFGVSLSHTVIMDLPLSLDPVNQLRGLPPVTYDSSQPSRFGVFPRRQPDDVRWFETDASCIFHTANTWDTSEVDEAGNTTTTEVNMLACRLTSATLIYASGNIAAPVERKPKVVLAETKKKRRMPFFSKYDDAESTVYERAALLESPDEDEEKEPFVHINPGPSPSPFTAPDETLNEDSPSWEEDQCRLYYYAFDLSSPATTNRIAHQWALTTIPFEFPSVRPDREMSAARYIYGCSTSSTSFGSALGKATKIDVLVKIDALGLVERGRASPPRSVGGSVDTRSMAAILASAAAEDPVKGFQMPEGWFAQEPRFVPKRDGVGEDDGWLLFYAFDEGQLLPSGDVPGEDGGVGGEGRAKSELWVLSTRDMKTVVARALVAHLVFLSKEAKSYRTLAVHTSTVTSTNS
ncbi:hypothetical protein LTS09_008330 [Friedmanniomyces endolithicus]|nr:hypothetical protein LTS09_008330 [Friedmanniomyces endolithicus]